MFKSIPVLLLCMWAVMVPNKLIAASESKTKGRTRIPAAVKPQAQEFPLAAVKLLDGPFKQAMEVDRAFLLRIEPDRLLAGFRMQAGLPRKAEPYGSREWEAIDSNSRYTMAGHSLGHYLSALAMMVVSTGDAECRRRADYIVSELKACQKAIGTGMLAAFPDSRGLFAELAAGKIESDHLFKLNGGYVPFYVIHKVMAGKLGTEGLEGLPFKGYGLFPKKLPFDTVPVFVGSTSDIVAKVKPVPGKPLEFRTAGLASPEEVTLAPFYSVHKQRYAVYWRLKDAPPMTPSAGATQERRTNHDER